MKVVHFLFRNILVYGYLKETREMLWAKHSSSHACELARRRCDGHFTYLTGLRVYYLRILSKMWVQQGHPL